MADYGLDIPQLRRYVVRPVLEKMGLRSLAAERLVLGTGAHESRYRYVHQVGGPAMGLWQMEPPTHADHYRNFLVYRPALKRRVIQIASWFSGDFPDPGEMVGNLNYACAMCRVQYFRVRAPLPQADDVHGLAEYAKSFYNTSLGRATVEQYESAIRDVIATEKP